MIYSFLIYNNLRKIKGDFEFKPSLKTKRLFIAVGALGILAVVVMIAGIIFALYITFSGLDNARSGAMDTARRSDIMQIQTKLLISMIH